MSVKTIPKTELEMDRGSQCPIIASSTPQQEEGGSEILKGDAAAPARVFPKHLTPPQGSAPPCRSFLGVSSPGTQKSALSLCSTPPCILKHHRTPRQVYARPPRPHPMSLPAPPLPAGGCPTQCTGQWRSRAAPSPLTPWRRCVQKSGEAAKSFTVPGMLLPQHDQPFWEEDLKGIEARGWGRAHLIPFQEPFISFRIATC